MSRAQLVNTHMPIKENDNVTLERVILVDFTGQEITLILSYSTKWKIHIELQLLSTNVSCTVCLFSNLTLLLMFSITHSPLIFLWLLIFSSFSCVHFTQFQRWPGFLDGAAKDNVDRFCIHHRNRLILMSF